MNFENDLNRDLQQDEPPEREISLGTATILGIFLALALICAAFFGFGYSLGRHSAQIAATAAAPDTKTEPRPDNTFSNFKTAPPSAEKSEPAPKEDSTQESPAPAAARPATAKQPAREPAAENQTAPVASAPLPATSSTGQFVVQVSATTREGDAQSLLAALKRKGYTATVRQEQDQRYHVQVGPFATRADAEAMRKQLDADGYKGPFIK